MTDAPTPSKLNKSSPRRPPRWIAPVGILCIVLVWVLALHNLYSTSYFESLIHIYASQRYTNILYDIPLTSIIIWMICIVVFLIFGFHGYKNNKLDKIILYSIIILLISFILTGFYYYSNTLPYEWGGVIIALWISTIIVVLYILNKFSPNFIKKVTNKKSLTEKEANKHKFFVSVIIIITASLLSMAVYFFPKTRINPALLNSYDSQNELSNPKIVKECREGIKTFHRNLHELNLNKHMISIIEKEHKKAVAEIDQRTKIDDSWFHNKFLLVGGLFAAFFAYFNPFSPMVRERTGSRSEQSNRWKELTRQIEDIFKTNIPSSVLGMAFIVSLAIDIHIRHNQMITQQLGLWIKNFVECLLSPGNTFIGWERFLRIDARIGESVITGMHRDLLFSMLNAVHFYFTSIILYILFISCLTLYASSCPISRQSGSRRTLMLIFCLVHFMLFLFALQGNIFPSTLDVQLVLWPGMWFRGDRGGVIPAAICLLVTYLAAMRVSTLLCYNDNLHEGSGSTASPARIKPRGWRE